MTRTNFPCPGCKTVLSPIEDEQGTRICPSCNKVLTAYEAGMEEVREFIRHVRMIEAIGRYRQVNSVDLPTAKDAVTEMWHGHDW